MNRILQTFLLLLFLIASEAKAQIRTVTGTVTGKEDGQPLPGVSVMVLGTKSGTQTGPDGSYSIKIAPGQSLTFSFIGFTTQTLSPNSDRLNVALSGSASALNEVVVTGYGTQLRRNNIGSVAAIKGPAIADAPVQSFDQALAGRASGVQITIPTGVLNSPPVFRIRGTNSISLSSQPLIVVDGQVVITGDLSLTSSSSNALANINPNDIESIDIAKDAAATAIYGSRAGNGVVFITTKKGKLGKPRISYDTWVGVTSPYRLPNMLNAFQYTDYKNEAVANANSIRSGSVVQSVGVPVQFKLTNGPDGAPINTNWYDYVYRDGVAYSHNLNVSGASDATTYYGSFGYTDQQGIYRKNELKRMNALFNLDSKVNKIITVGGKLSFSNEQNIAAASSGSLNGEAYGTTGLARTAMVNSPNVSPYNNDGSYNIGATYVGPMNNVAIGNQVGFYNPVYVLNNNRENTEIDHLQSNAYLQIKPVSWVTLKSQYGIDYIDSDNDEFYAPLHGPGQSLNGEATAAFRKYKRWTWTNTAQLTYSFAQKHNFDFLAGQEQQRNTTRGYGIDRQTLSDPAYTVVQAGFTTPQNYAQLLTENYLSSVFGRLTYNFDQKYYLSGNIRQDNYSALGVKKGTFYGLGAGWEITKEKFWSNAGLDKVFTSFRLRGSYGKVGNVSGIGDFASFSTYNSGLYGGASTLSFNAAGNKALQWETSKKTDVGLTYGLLNDRLTGEIAYYNNNIDGLILNVPQIPSAGLPSTTIAQNAGSMYNRGVEFSIGGAPILTKSFTWNSNFNISYNKNMVTKLATGLNEILTATGTTTTGESPSRTVPGYSVGYLYVVRTGGVDPTTGRRIFYNAAGKALTYQHITSYANGVSGATLPQWNYLDGTAGATAITQSADAVMYKNTAPKFVGGFDNNFKYKGFDVDVLLTYQLGFWVYYGSNSGLHDQRYWNNTVDVLQRWTKPGDVTDFVRPIYGDNVSYGNTIPLDVNVFKGDFVKFKNVTLGYTLPKTAAGKIGLSNARIYVSGQNLAVITKYPGPDPEVASNGTSSSGQGTDRNGGPNARTFTLGLNIGF
jgi:TonB-linked SusC/RagA family outer membrane protein